MNIPVKHFYMIRHGQTEANAGEYMAGSLDSPLTDLGRAQAETARIKVEALINKPRVIMHSNLSRARETAEIINQNLGLPMIEEPDCAEMSVGEWEGKPYAECLELFDNWTNPPNGETHNEFIQRITRAKNKALSLKESPPLIVCHGGVFRAFAKAYNVDIWGTENCHLHEFTPDPSGGSFPWIATNFHYDDKLIASVSETFHPSESAD